MKRKPIEWEKLFVSQISDKSLIYKYTMTSYNLTEKKKQIKMGKVPKQTFFNEDIQ